MQYDEQELRLYLYGRHGLTDECEPQLIADALHPLAVECSPHAEEPLLIFDALHQAWKWTSEITDIPQVPAYNLTEGHEVWAHSKGVWGWQRVHIGRSHTGRPRPFYVDADGVWQRIWDTKPLAREVPCADA